MERRRYFPSDRPLLSIHIISLFCFISFFRDHLEQRYALISDALNYNLFGGNVENDEIGIGIETDAVFAHRDATCSPFKTIHI